MKLKNVLMLAFLALTLLPTVAISVLLYKSGLNLSKESYARNLIESIAVQADYISQSIEANMITNYRFVNQTYAALSDAGADKEKQRNVLLTAFQGYLEASEDNVAVCMLLDQDKKSIYALGEKNVLDLVTRQLPELSDLSGQVIMDFELEEGVYSLGILTPVRSKSGMYRGHFVSVYSKYSFFKSISSYYKLADTSLYICRKNGGVVNFRKLTDQRQNEAIKHVLDQLTFTVENLIDTKVNGVQLLGYYKNIHGTPWYLVGFVDYSLISAFANRFVWAYLFAIVGVLAVGIGLSFYFSRKVVKPINNLIAVMDEYQSCLTQKLPQCVEEKSYFEIQYLRTKFSDLMKTILLVRHNFEGVYQLYQSNDMGDVNIDIDVKGQTIASNKKEFQKLMNELEVREGACIVERFVNCFQKEDQHLLMDMLEKMRDEHLSVTKEANVYTPHLNQRWFHILVVPMYEDDRLSRLFVQLRDISSFKKQELASIEQARRDPLTGLYNRSGFIARASELLQAGATTGKHALLFIDMDDFKLVNDNFGHSAGDELLCSVAKTLLENIGADGVASRFGGDEFAVFLPHVSDEQFDSVLKELRSRLMYPFRTKANLFVVSASIGHAVWVAEKPCTLDELLHQADVDMYNAKRLFKQNTKLMQGA